MIGHLLAMIWRLDMALPPPLREVEVDNARKVAGEAFFKKGQRLRDCFKSASMVCLVSLPIAVAE
jgi:hypothetical protein